MNEVEQPLPPVQKRQRGRGLLVGTCVGLLLLFIGAIAYGFSQLGKTFTTESTPTIDEIVVRGTGTNKIALLKLHGVIMQDGLADPASGIISATSVKAMIDKAKSDDQVKAVILDIDSPGGSVVPSVQIYEALKDLDQAKPIVALYSGEVAASGAVYLSMGARKIVSYPETLTGSIGVIAEFFDLSGLMEKYGVRQNVIKSGQFKDIGNPARAMTDAEEQLLQGLIDETYDQFVSVIVENRALAENTVREFADGRIFSGTQALELGMVDGLGDQDEAEQLAKELAGITEAQIVEYEEPLSFGSLFSFFGAKLQPTDPFGLINQRRNQPNLQLLYLMQ